MKRAIFFLLPLLSSCAAQTRLAHQSVLEDMRIALLDVKSACSKQQMELNIIEERLETMSPTPHAVAKSANLENRLIQLEKMIDKIRSDLHELGTHANQTTQSLHQYKTQIEKVNQTLKVQEQRLADVTKLKGTLHSISEAIAKENKEASIYTVRSGDSLERIARTHGTSVEALKRENGLQTSKIIIGQKIRIPQQ